MKLKQNKSLCLKRKDIIICPYFRLNYWEYKKNRYAFDMHCALDDAIFFSYHSNKPGLTKRDIKIMKMSMKDSCSAECPKMWVFDQIDDYDYDEELYQQMLRDSGGCPPEFDENFNFGNPPF